MKTPRKVTVPQRITILTPLPKGFVTRGRGEDYKGSDPQRTFRCSDERYATIDSAAELLGCTTPEFIRWVAYAAANEVIRQVEEAAKQTNTEPVVAPKPVEPQPSKGMDASFIVKPINPYSR